MVSTASMAVNLPVYLTIDVEDEEKADRFLESLASKIFLKGGQFYTLPTRVDAYRLPDYKEHATYVVSYQLYAAKIRLYLSRVSGRLVAATRLSTLREAIDALTSVAQEEPKEAHLVLRLNRKALNKLQNNINIYWAEKTRRACHGNIMSIYNLINLYDNT